MRLRCSLICIALGITAGCATPRQYVYNCTLGTVTVDGKRIASRTFALRSAASSDAGAIHADGTIHPPLRVPSSQVHSFGLSNAWISPANVCRQFGPQVVIVDLR